MKIKSNLTREEICKILEEFDIFPDGIRGVRWWSNEFEINVIFPKARYTLIQLIRQLIHIYQEQMKDNSKRQLQEDIKELLGINQAIF